MRKEVTPARPPKPSASNSLGQTAPTQTNADKFVAANAENVELLTKQPHLVVFKTLDGENEFNLDTICIDPRLPLKLDQEQNDGKSDSKPETDARGVPLAYMDVVRRKIFDQMGLKLGAAATGTSPEVKADKCKIQLTNKKTVDISPLKSDNNYVSYATAVAMRNKYFTLNNMPGRGLRCDIVAGLIKQAKRGTQKVDEAGNCSVEKWMVDNVTKEDFDAVFGCWRGLDSEKHTNGDVQCVLDEHQFSTMFNLPKQRSPFCSKTESTNGEESRFYVRAMSIWYIPQGSRMVVDVVLAPLPSPPSNSSHNLPAIFDQRTDNTVDPSSQPLLSKQRRLKLSRERKRETPEEKKARIEKADKKLANLERRIRKLQSLLSMPTAYARDQSTVRRLTWELESSHMRMRRLQKEKRTNAWGLSKRERFEKRQAILVRNAKPRKLSKEKRPKVNHEKTVYSDAEFEQLYVEYAINDCHRNDSHNSLPRADKENININEHDKPMSSFLTEFYDESKPTKSTELDKPGEVQVQVWCQDFGKEVAKNARIRERLLNMSEFTREHAQQIIDQKKEEETWREERKCANQMAAEARKAQRDEYRRAQQEKQETKLKEDEKAAELNKNDLKRSILDFFWKWDARPGHKEAWRKYCKANPMLEELKEAGRKDKDARHLALEIFQNTSFKGVSYEWNGKEKSMPTKDPSEEHKKRRRHVWYNWFCHGKDIEAEEKWEDHLKQVLLMETHIAAEAEKFESKQLKRRRERRERWYNKLVGHSSARQHVRDIREVKKRVKTKARDKSTAACELYKKETLASAIEKHEERQQREKHERILSIRREDEQYRLMEQIPGTIENRKYTDRQQNLVEETLQKSSKCCIEIAKIVTN